MTATGWAAWLDDLHQAAHAAGVAEEQFRKEAARQAAELATARAFAWRRLNLLRAVARAVAGTQDEAAATAAGRAAFLRETGLAGAGGGSPAEVADRFSPVVVAVWHATRPDAPDDAAAEAGAALAAFEGWYGDTRSTAFLHLMEREIVELPLVEV